VNPRLYQLNPKLFLSSVGRSATLDDIPDSLLESLQAKGFDWVWLLGVWSVGQTGAKIARQPSEWRRECLSVLPDLTDDDIVGSPFAVCSYTVDDSLGGNAALARVRHRLQSFDLKLMLDFVPNHIGHDHPWVRSNPDFLITGTAEQLNSDPLTWTRLEDNRIVAFGRDPNFPGWTDTLQLNYFNPALRVAMLDELLAISRVCDGVRCDMAMLIEPEVFRETWGKRAPHAVQGFNSFWHEAIATVRRSTPEFLFAAEVYWDYEYKLQQHGFDFTYDKRLYDRILEGDGERVCAHLRAPLNYQQKMVRFLENHDEPRIASTLSLQEHRAAAVVTFFAPGMRLIHDGQLTGRRLRVPVQLRRAPHERSSEGVENLYREVLPLAHSPAVTHGKWHLLETREAWPYNPSHVHFVAYLIEHPLRTLLVVVNYWAHRGQCFVRIPDRPWLEGTVEFRDLLSQERLVRPASDILDRGLFLDCAEWQSHVFSIEQS
jgi:glycosidase